MDEINTSKKTGQNHSLIGNETAEIMQSDSLFTVTEANQTGSSGQQRSSGGNGGASSTAAQDPNAAAQPFMASASFGAPAGGPAASSAPVSGFTTMSLTGTDGTPGDDVLTGDNTDETFFGFAGDDTIDGQGGNDVMNGGVGNDTYIAGDGLDTIVEEGGTNDVLVVNALFTDIVAVDASTDDFVIVLDPGVDEITIQGQNGPDPDQKIETLRFADGFEISFADFQTWITLTTASPNYNGSADNEVIVGSDDVNFITSGDGDDIVYGAGGSDFLQGGAGDDIVFGGTGDDQAIEGDGDDIIHGGDGNDFLFGAGGNDTLYGDAGNDTLIGAGGADVLYGGDGDDSLQGTEEDDILNGDAGADSMFGGLGNDTLNGGAGNDTYFFNPGEGSDIITEAGGLDSIEVNASIAFGDITFTRYGDDLVIATVDNSMLIRGQFSGDPDLVVEIIDVSDNPNFDLTTLNLVDQNTAPDAAADTFDALDADNFAGNVIGNDSDVDGDSFSVNAASFTTTNGGTVTIAANGDFTYTAAADFAGTDSFTYTVTDEHGATDTATVTLNNVLGPITNVDPVAADDNITTDEDTAVSGNVLVDNGNGADSDANGDTLTVTAGTFATVMGGSVTVSANGDFTYTPAADFNGADSFTYTVSDGNGGSDTGNVSLTVNSVNDAPDAQDDSFDATNGSNFSGNVMGNDSDSDGGLLNVVAGIFVTTGGGSVTVSANGDFTYDAADGFVGSDSFTYTLDDGQGGTDTATVTLNNVLGQQPPAAADDAFTTDEDTAVSGNVLADNGSGADSDINGDTLTVTAGIFATAMGGSVTVSANGDFTYTPATNFNGADSFSYTVSDGNGGSDAGNVSLTVNAINDAPDAQDDGFDAASASSFAGNVIGNDSDLDGDAISVTAATFTTANGGAVNILANGDFTYDAADGFVGSDSFTYILDDGQGGTDTAIVTLNNVLGQQPPAAADDAFTTDEDTAVSGNVLADNGSGVDSDINGDTLTVTAATLTTAMGGTVALAANGDFTYTPATDFNGADSFTYTVSDGNGGSATGNVALTVNAINDAPDAQDDSFDAASSASVAGNVMGNDNDIDGDAISVTPATFTTANGGTVVLSANGDFTYDAVEGFTGNDSFSYTLSDGNGGSDTATVTLNNVSFPVVDIAPEILPENVSVDVEFMEVDIPFDLDPTPQDFPDLVERARLNPPSVINGTNREHLSFDHDHEVQIKFVTEGAGYKNTFGMYTIAEDGTIENVEILAENLSGTGGGVFGGGTFNPGDVIADLGSVPAGTEIGFFIIANGANKNSGTFNSYDIENGALEFRNTSTGDASTITDNANDTQLYFTDAGTGDVIALNGNTWHSSFESLNSDGAVHAVSGTNDNGNLTIGFEDLKNLGDADFNDVVIEMVVAPATEVILDPIQIAENFDVIDADDNSIMSMDVEMIDGTQIGDYLSIDASLLAGTNITLTQISDVAFSLHGADTTENYEAVIQSLTFGSNADDLVAGTRNISLTVTDADGLTDSSTIDVNVGESGSFPPAPSPALAALGEAFDDDADMFADVDDDCFEIDHGRFRDFFGDDDDDHLDFDDILEAVDDIADAIDDMFGDDSALGKLSSFDILDGGFDSLLADGFLGLADSPLSDDDQPQGNPWDGTIL